MTRIDTFPHGTADTVNSTPQPVILAAQRCSAKFSVETILQQANQDINLLENAFELLLYADRIQDAMDLTQRWIGSLAADDTLRCVITERLSNFLLSARPVRFAETVQLVNSLALPRFWVVAIEVMNRAFTEATRLNDTTRAESVARWLVGLPQILGDEILRTALWRALPGGKGFYVRSAQHYLHADSLIAKLRNSTDAYNDYLALLDQQSGLAIPKTSSNIKAKPILADWWFPTRPTSDRPALGKVTLVYAMVGNECLTCQGWAARLRRLHQKFPEIEIIMLFRTRGVNGDLRSPFAKPEAEAQFLDSLWRIHQRSPIMVAVEDGKFWRLPDPDRRRVEEPGPNHEMYPTIGLFPTVYTFDKEGRVVAPIQLRGKEGDEFLLYEILLKRPSQ